MEQNQAMPGQPTNPVVAALEQTEPVQPVAAAPVQAAPAPKKKNSTMALVIILLVLIALGGIGFGVWAIMDGNARVETAKKNCSGSTEVITNCDVDGNNGGDSDGTGTNTSTDTTPIFKNPVISSTVGNYNVSINETVVISNDKSLNINVKNGEVVGCHYSDGGDCTISGISGKIFKMSEFGAGQDIEGFYQGFLMEDGTVQYFGLKDASEKTNYSIEGTLKINGKVKDIISVGALETGREVGGFGTSLFILSDGSIVMFDISMLQ